MTREEVLALPICGRGSGTVGVERLNVRKTPELRDGQPAGQVIGQLRRGERVIVWAQDGPFWLVQGESVTGWAWASFITSDGELIP